MSNPQNFKSKEEDEHSTVLKSAHEILKQSAETRKIGRQRLENALKRYKERSG